MNLKTAFNIWLGAKLFERSLKKALRRSQPIIIDPAEEKDTSIMVCSTFGAALTTFGLTYILSTYHLIEFNRALLISVFICYPAWCVWWVSKRKKTFKDDLARCSEAEPIWTTIGIMALWLFEIKCHM